MSFQLFYTEDGTPYYFDARTGRSLWASAADWEAVEDPRTGALVYRNTITGEVSFAGEGGGAVHDIPQYESSAGHQLRMAPSGHHALDSSSPRSAEVVEGPSFTPPSKKKGSRARSRSARRERAARNILEAREKQHLAGDALPYASDTSYEPSSYAAASAAAAGRGRSPKRTREPIDEEEDEDASDAHAHPQSFSVPPPEPLHYQHQHPHQHPRPYAPPPPVPMPPVHHHSYPQQHPQQHAQSQYPPQPQYYGHPAPPQPPVSYGQAPPFHHYEPPPTSDYDRRPRPANEEEGRDEGRRRGGRRDRSSDDDDRRRRRRSDDESDGRRRRRDDDKRRSSRRSRSRSDSRSSDGSSRKGRSRRRRDRDRGRRSDDDDYSSSRSSDDSRDRSRRRGGYRSEKSRGSRRRGGRRRSSSDDDDDRGDDKEYRRRLQLLKAEKEVERRLAALTLKTGDSKNKSRRGRSRQGSETGSGEDTDGSERRQTARKAGADDDNEDDANGDGDGGGDSGASSPNSAILYAAAGLNKDGSSVGGVGAIFGGLFDMCSLSNLQHLAAGKQGGGNRDDDYASAPGSPVGATAPLNRLLLGRGGSSAPSLPFHSSSNPGFSSPGAHEAEHGPAEDDGHSHYHTNGAAASASAHEPHISNGGGAENSQEAAEFVGMSLEERSAWLKRKLNGFGSSVMGKTHVLAIYLTTKSLPFISTFISAANNKGSNDSLRIVKSVAEAAMRTLSPKSPPGGHLPTHYSGSAPPTGMQGGPGAAGAGWGRSFFGSGPAASAAGGRPGSYAVAAMAAGSAVATSRKLFSQVHGGAAGVEYGSAAGIVTPDDMNRTREAGLGGEDSDGYVSLASPGSIASPQGHKRGFYQEVSAGQGLATATGGRAGELYSCSSLPEGLEEGGEGAEDGNDGTTAPNGANKQAASGSLVDRLFSAQHISRLLHPGAGANASSTLPRTTDAPLLPVSMTTHYHHYDGRPVAIPPVRDEPLADGSAANDFHRRLEEAAEAVEGHGNGGVRSLGAFLPTGEEHVAEGRGSRVDAEEGQGPAAGRVDPSSYFASRPSAVGAAVAGDAVDGSIAASYANHHLHQHWQPSVETHHYEGYDQHSQLGEGQDTTNMTAGMVSLQGSPVKGGPKGHGLFPSMPADVSHHRSPNTTGLMSFENNSASVTKAGAAAAVLGLEGIPPVMRSSVNSFLPEPAAPAVLAPADADGAETPQMSFVVAGPPSLSTARSPLPPQGPPPFDAMDVALLSPGSSKAASAAAAEAAAAAVTSPSDVSLAAPALNFDAETYLASPARRSQNLPQHLVAQGSSMGSPLGSRRNPNNHISGSTVLSPARRTTAGFGGPSFTVDTATVKDGRAATASSFGLSFASVSSPDNEDRQHRRETSAGLEHRGNQEGQQDAEHEDGADGDEEAFSIPQLARSAVRRPGSSLSGASGSSLGGGITPNGPPASFTGTAAVGADLVTTQEAQDENSQPSVQWERRGGKLSPSSKGALMSAPLTSASHASSPAAGSPSSSTSYPASFTSPMVSPAGSSSANFVPSFGGMTTAETGPDANKRLLFGHDGPDPSHQQASGHAGADGLPHEQHTGEGYYYQQESPFQSYGASAMSMMMMGGGASMAASAPAAGGARGSYGGYDDGAEADV